MTATWVLLAMFKMQTATLFNTSTITLDFSTQAQCEAAKAKISALVPTSTRTQSNVVYSYCFQK